jgi:hypothetical protein
MGSGPVLCGGLGKAEGDHAVGPRQGQEVTSAYVLLRYCQLLDVPRRRPKGDKWTRVYSFFGLSRTLRIIFT